MIPLLLLLASAPFRDPDAWVVNPASKAKLAVWVDAPSGDGPFPTLVAVPGAVGDAHHAVPMQDRATWFKAGFALVTFDPDGRGKSGGAEDYGGRTQQDGLAAVIRWARTAPHVDGARIAVMSMSYGITMAAGALAREPDLGALFLLDFEGPADRTSTAGCGRPARPQAGAKAPPGVSGAMAPPARADAQPPPAEAVAKTPPAQAGARAAPPQRERIEWGACDDDAWWSDREAVKAIGALRIPYQRVQFARDHVQPNLDHAVAMVDAAVDGGVPWVRLDDDPPGTRFTSAAEVHALPNGSAGVALSGYARALMAQVTGTDVAPGTPPARTAPRPPR